MVTVQGYKSGVMIEVWIQWTCDGDGCEETDFSPYPNMTRTQVWAMLKKSGWKRNGDKHYCPKCATNNYSLLSFTS